MQSNADDSLSTSSTSTEPDNLLKILEVLRENRAEYDKALHQWNIEYKDVLDEEQIRERALMTSSGFRRTVSESKLSTKRTRFPSLNMKESMQSVCENGGYFDVSSNTSSLISLDNYEGFEDELSLIEQLSNNLIKDKQRVEERFSEMEQLMIDVQNENEENSRLQDRVAMAHRSLTLLELRQEKVMRDALYDNITANTTVRQLQDEVVQLRIREAQNRSDLQRLTSENSRLKLKVMEMRKMQKSATSKPPDPQPPKPVHLKTKSRPTTSGLMALDELCRPDHLDSTVVHRGTMKCFNRTVGIKLSPSTVPQQSVVKNSKCPLCGRRTIEAESSTDSDDVTITPGSYSLSKSTSTKEIENIVSLRTSISFLGFRVPIPLFFAIFLQAIDNCLLMLGHICFVEYPPLNFPELSFRVVDMLQQIRSKIHSTRVYS